MQNCWQLFKKLLSFSYLCRLERWREALVEETQEIGVPKIRHDKRHRITIQGILDNQYLLRRSSEGSVFFQQPVIMLSPKMQKSGKLRTKQQLFSTQFIYMVSFKSICRVSIASFTIYLLSSKEIYRIEYWIVHGECHD